MRFIQETEKALHDELFPIINQGFDKPLLHIDLAHEGLYDLMADEVVEELMPKSLQGLVLGGVVDEDEVALDLSVAVGFIIGTPADLKLET